MKKNLKNILACLLVLALSCGAALAEGGAQSVSGLFGGVWISGDYTLVINEENGAFTCGVAVTEENGDLVTWEYAGCMYDEISNGLTSLEVGVKTRHTFDDGGVLKSSEDEYTDGAAAFTINDEGMLVWEDFKKTPGENTMTFRRIDNDFAGSYMPDFGDMWVKDNASLYIFDFGDGSYGCIVWVEEEGQSTRWVYDCAYDETTGELYSQETGVKTVFTVDPESGEEKEEDIYTDGAALFTPTGDGRMGWTDLKEGTDTTILFERAEEVADFPMAEDSLHASVQPIVDSPAWVTQLEAAQDENVKQLFIVAGMGMDKTTASISMHARDLDGNWKQLLSTPGYVGKNGLCLDADHAEGCGQTPVGVYRFNCAFGNAADPGCALPYTRVTDDLYWSGDQREGMRYNELVSIQDYPDLNTGDSEHLIEYEYQYCYALNISFNEEGTPGRGSAIFLHCLGPTKPYTGGCVAIPENIMKLVMQYVTEDCVVVIDTLENMNGEL